MLAWQFSVGLKLVSFINYRLHVHFGVKFCQVAGKSLKRLKYMTLDSILHELFDTKLCLCTLSLETAI